MKNGPYNLTMCKNFCTNNNYLKILNSRRVACNLQKQRFEIKHFKITFLVIVYRNHLIILVKSSVIIRMYIPLFNIEKLLLFHKHILNKNEFSEN